MLAIMLYASILTSFVEVKDWTSALYLVLMVSILNVLLKPLLIILTIPITMLTMGLFLLFINAIILGIADRLIDGVDIHGFWGTVAFSIILTLTSSILDKLIDEPKSR